MTTKKLQKHFSRPFLLIKTIRSLGGKMISHANCTDYFKSQYDQFILNETVETNGNTFVKQLIALEWNHKREIHNMNFSCRVWSFLPNKKFLKPVELNPSQYEYNAYFWCKNSLSVHEHIGPKNKCQHN